MHELLKSKSGFSYVKTAVLILIMAMIFSAVMLYASMMTIIQTSKENTLRVLDSFVTHNSKEIYDSLKNGNDFSDNLDENYYTSSLKSEFSLDFSGNTIYSKGKQGNIIYTMTNPHVAYDYNNTLKLKASYDLSIPVTFGGKHLFDFKIPVSVKSYYNLKYDS